MREHSSTFTAADIPRFFDQIFDWEMHHTADRLRRASERVQELAARVPETSRSDAEWNAKEVLAHIAVLSRAYGIFSYMIATGRLTELLMAEVISQRDVEGDRLMALPASEIAAEAARQHQRTLGFLETATSEQLRNECKVEQGSMTAEYVLRLPLVAHLEEHVEQLQRALA
jgi:hypothetical protein